MVTIARYLVIFAIAVVAVKIEPASYVQNGMMQKEIIAAALIALLSLPTVLRWTR